MNRCFRSRRPGSQRNQLAQISRLNPRAVCSDTICEASHSSCAQGKPPDAAGLETKRCLGSRTTSCPVEHNAEVISLFQVAPAGMRCSILGIFPFRENGQPLIAESRAPGSQLPEPSPQSNFVPFLLSVLVAPAAHPDQHTGAALADPANWSDFSVSI